MAHLKMPPHLIDHNGVKRCSACDVAFPPGSQPSISKAFAAHVRDEHKPAEEAETGLA